MKITKFELVYLSAMVMGMLALFYAAQTGNRPFAYVVGGVCICALLTCAAYSIFARQIPASSAWHDDVSEKAGNRIVTLAVLGWLLVLTIMYFTAVLLSQHNSIALVAVALGLLGGAVGTYFLRAHRSVGWIRATAIAYSIAIAAVIPVMVASGLL